MMMERPIDKLSGYTILMSYQEKAISEAATLLRRANYLIALTGAGISKESNVPTFRGKDGLWRNYDAMELATPDAFARNPELVWEWYSWRQDLISNCQPNPAHKTLAKWEGQGLLKHIITQNVDDLHRRGGARNVTKLHGDIFKVKCVRCTYNTIIASPPEGIPKCVECGANLRPDVVWFGESLDPEILNFAYRELGQADLVLVVGTSGLVQPAASFPLIVKRNGGLMIELNPDATPLTSYADIHIQGKAGEVLPQLDELLQ